MCSMKCRVAQRMVRWSIAVGAVFCTLPSMAGVKIPRQIIVRIPEIWCRNGRPMPSGTAWLVILVLIMLALGIFLLWYALSQPSSSTFAVVRKQAAKRGGVKGTSDDEIRNKLNAFLLSHIGYKFGDKLTEGSGVQHGEIFPMCKPYGYFTKALVHLNEDGIHVVTLISKVDKKYSQDTVEMEFQRSVRKLFSICGCPHSPDQPFNTMCKWVTVVLGSEGVKGLNYVYSIRLEDTYCMAERLRREQSKGVPLHSAD